MIKPGAVLTADIVNSTRLGSKGTTEVASALDKVLRHYKATMISFYRGDSFQCLIYDPAVALRLALALRIEVRILGHRLTGTAADLRISIALGSIPESVTPRTAQHLTFKLSGIGLDRLEKSQSRLHVQSEQGAGALTFTAISQFADYLISRLTFKQAEILQYLLQGYNQTEIASITDKSQSTVNRHIKTLGWKQLKRLLEIFLQAVEQLYLPHGNSTYLAISDNQRPPAC